MPDTKKHHHLNLRTQVFLLLTLMFGILTSLSTLEQIRDYQHEQATKLRQFRWVVRWIDSEQQRHIAQARQVAFLAMNEIRKGSSDEFFCRNGVVGTPGLDPEYGHLAIADPDGMVSCNSIPWLKSSNVADQRYFKEATKRVDIGFIGEADNRKPGQYAAIKARAMRDQSGNVVKVILVAMDFSWIKEEVKTANLPSAAHLLLVDAKGTLVAGSPNMDKWVDKSIADTPFYRQISTHKAESFDGIGFEGEKSYIISHPINTAAGFLRVIIDIPRHTLLQPVYTALITRFLVSITAFLLILALALYWSNRFFLRKVVALEQAARKLADGDWTARTGIVGTNELGHLARSFDLMADTLQTKEAELEEANNQLHRINRTLRVLSAGNRTLLFAKTEEELLARAARDIVEVGHYVAAWIGFMGAEQDQFLHTAAAYSRNEHESPSMEWINSGIIPGTLATHIRSDKVLTINDTSLKQARRKLGEEAEKLGYRSVIALPLHFEGKPFGALLICAYRKNEFIDAQTVNYLKETAHDISLGIEMFRTRSERDRLALLEEGHELILKDSLEDALNAIAITIEMRDPYTAGHQRRVAQLAAAIARELKLDEEEVHGIYLAAIVHDIGKIKVPAEVLVKPGKLSDVEYALVKNHVEASYDILKNIQFPWPIADMVHQHHERMDGSGYPQGIKGGDILFGARILAVADVVEAMSSHRPYREGLGIEAALAEIKKGSSSLYDASVVKACLKLFRDNNFQFMEVKERKSHSS